MYLLKSNQHCFVIRFQNNNYNYLFFTDSDKSLEELGAYLCQNKTLIIKDIKIYDQPKTRYVRANKNMLKSIFKWVTILDVELERRNFY
jgi:hypothetical protein